MRGGEGRWDEVKGGRLEVKENGDDCGSRGVDTDQSYLRLTANPDVIAREIENLMLGRSHVGCVVYYGLGKSRISSVKNRF